MDNLENTENYDLKEFGKDVTKEIAKTAAVVAVGTALWLGANYAGAKIVEFKNSRAAKKAETE